MSTKAQVFYPTTNSPDQALTGANVVRKLVEASPAVNNTTVLNTSATSATTLTVIPFATNSTGGNTSQNNGWAFSNGESDGLGSTSSAQRIIPAGQWVFKGTLNLNAPAVGGTESAQVTAYVYRVASGGGARTLLFSAAAAAVTNTGIQAADSGWSVTSAAQPQILLAAGEVIEIGYTVVTAATTLATTTTNSNVIFVVGTGTVNALSVTVPAPGVRTQNNLTLASATAHVGKVIKAIQKKLKSATTHTPTFKRRLSLSKTFKGTTTHTPAFIKNSRLSRVFKAATTHKAKAFIQLPFGKLPAGTGGGGTTIVNTIKKYFSVQE